MQKTIETAFDPEMWKLRSEGYAELGWVNSAELLDYIAEILELCEEHIVIDAGAGSLAVSKAIAHLTKVVHAFDISPEMLASARGIPSNVKINPEATSIYENGYPDGFADYLVARMVFHHLDDIQKAVLESLRVVKENGSVLIIEYIVPNDECLQFEKAVFSIKEPDRHLWTPSSFQKAISDNLVGNEEIKVTFKTLDQYSVGDWLSKSGLPESEQSEMFALYLSVSTTVRRDMNIRYVQYRNGETIEVNPEIDEVHDVLVDRQFAYLQIHSKK